MAHDLTTAAEQGVVHETRPVRAEQLHLRPDLVRNLLARLGVSPGAFCLVSELSDLPPEILDVSLVSLGFIRHGVRDRSQRIQPFVQLVELGGDPFGNLGRAVVNLRRRRLARDVGDLLQQLPAELEQLRLAHLRGRRGFLFREFLNVPPQRGDVLAVVDNLRRRRRGALRTASPSLLLHLGDRRVLRLDLLHECVQILPQRRRLPVPLGGGRTPRVERRGHGIHRVAHGGDALREQLGSLLRRPDSVASDDGHGAHSRAHRDDDRD
mmetsp:Transcript_7604/g.30817  ORF Transcript_7604/g.30817 Transcript_7604/m.30817 type:complete len:267 (+) Transcript_7604:1162-1962(+)